MKRIFVLGYFGYVNNQLDGQTIKTRTLYELIKSKSIFRISYFDNQRLKKNKFLLFSSFMSCIISDIVVYMPAYKNFTFLFPCYYMLSKIFRFQIIYPVVGGWLASYLASLPLHRYMLKHIKIILVESDFLKRELQQKYNLENVQWFPNFRIHHFLPEKQNLGNNVLRIVFFARIIKEKGLDAVFRFADYIVQNELQGEYVIHFYGPMGDQEYFEENLKKYDFISYGGILMGQQIYSVLQTYDVLILPTYYKGEGFPGSILDAYIAGIPVICSRWKYLPEFIEEGQTGYTYDLSEEQLLFDQLIELKRSPDLLKRLKNNAKAASHKYSQEVAWKIIREYLS